MSAADDALDVARFCWPQFAWEQDDYTGECYTAEDNGDVFDPQPQMLFWGKRHRDIAAAERVLVDERGLGEEYGRALLRELNLVPEWVSSNDIATVRTAPLEVCLRALARVVREQQKPKETK